MLNVALFGMTAAQWCSQNPGCKGNIRDYATLQQLLVLANMESYNAMLIEQKRPQHERIQTLRLMAVKQLQTLSSLDTANLPQLPEDGNTTHQATKNCKNQKVINSFLACMRAIY